MTVAESIKLTADQYLALGEDPPGVRLELVEGEIRVSPSPTTVHAFVVSQLLQILGHHIQTHKLGVIMSDTDHILNPRNVRRPDLYFFSTVRMHLLDEDVIRAAPDLAIEVISPGSEHTDRVEKFKAYQLFGIAHYWIIDPQRRTADAFSLKRRKYLPAGTARGNATVNFPPFEDLTLGLRELWWPPRP